MQPSRRHLFRVIAAAAAMVPWAASNAAATGRRHHHYHGHWNPPSGGGHMCLLRGTEIATDKGSLAIERLTVGDRVLTESGAYKPIKAIGRNVFHKAGDSWDASVAPVRIAAAAIAPNVPARDLYLTPEHALFIDGCLIRVKDLVNGVSITQDFAHGAETLEYFHLVLDRHDVFYAEGAAVESLRAAAPDAEKGFADYQGAYGVPVTPYAPILGYYGGRQDAVALLRLAVYPLIDVRDRIQVIYDRLAARAKLLPAGESETALAA